MILSSSLNPLFNFATITICEFNLNTNKKNTPFSFQFSIKYIIYYTENRSQIRITGWLDITAKAQWKFPTFSQSQFTNWTYKSYIPREHEVQDIYKKIRPKAKKFEHHIAGNLKTENSIML